MLQFNFKSILRIWSGFSGDLYYKFLKFIKQTKEDKVEDQLKINIWFGQLIVDKQRWNWRITSFKKMLFIIFHENTSILIRPQWRKENRKSKKKREGELQGILMYRYNFQVVVLQLGGQ